MSFDPELFGRAMGDAIRAAVEPLREEVARLKEQLAESSLEKSIKGLVADAVKELPAPTPGKSVTLEDVRPVLDAAVQQIRKEADEAIAEPLRSAEAARDSLLKAVGELRQPEDGKSVTLKDVQPLVDEAIKAISDEAQRRVEQALKDLPEPKPGVGVAGAMIDRDGCLLLTLSNGEVKSLGVVVGSNGADFTETSFDYDGERTLTIHGKSGSITKHLPIPLDRGYYRDGMPIQKGDIVTHDGSAWIALKDTKERPGHDYKEDWRLLARKGRDGESIVRKVTTGPAEPIKLKDQA
ncbi:hypothetical protein [Achromobacter insolitus]|uniref:hypothetical protein n=1 Tax=Achromobacter insolitus TaxID=217204 RepID=UPI002FE08808